MQTKVPYVARLAWGLGCISIGVSQAETAYIRHNKSISPADIQSLHLA